MTLDLVLVKIFDLFITRLVVGLGYGAAVIITFALLDRVSDRDRT